MYQSVEFQEFLINERDWKKKLKNLKYLVFVPAHIFQQEEPTTAYAIF